MDYENSWAGNIDQIAGCCSQQSRLKTWRVCVYSISDGTEYGTGLDRTRIGDAGMKRPKIEAGKMSPSSILFHTFLAWCSVGGSAFDGATHTKQLLRDTLRVAASSQFPLWRRQKRLDQSRERIMHATALSSTLTLSLCRRLSTHFSCRWYFCYRTATPNTSRPAAKIKINFNKYKSNFPYSCWISDRRKK